jgi:mannitol operon transcriptional antiterminator
MDQSFLEVKHLVLLLSPEIQSESGLEVLSFLSTLLIESDESISLFQSNDQERISAFLSARLDQYFHEKVQELRRV